MSEINLKINGMTCVGCENNIKCIIKSIKGVKSVSANHKSGDVKIFAKDNIGIDVLKRKIEELGYEVIVGERR